MFLQTFHIFINKRAMLRQKFTVQVTTLPDCDDITRFDGTYSILELSDPLRFKLVKEGDLTCWVLKSNPMKNFSVSPSSSDIVFPSRIPGDENVF
jgi:hypothetical protein